jgi:hypothetical protein
MRRCYYCERWIWPWQAAGWYVVAARPITPEDVRRWHVACWVKTH